MELQDDKLDILGFYEGKSKRIALLADFDDIVTIPIVVEEYASVQNRTNSYSRFFAVIPVYDYEERRVRLIAALPHQTIIKTLKSIYEEIPDIRERYDLVISLNFDQSYIDNLCVLVQFAKKYSFYSISEKAKLNYNQMKDAVIAWRIMLGERIIA